MARVVARRIKLWDVRPGENPTDAVLDRLSAEGFDQAGELHTVVEAGEVASEEWVKQLRRAIQEPGAPVFQVYRPPAGQERIPRALGFTVSDSTVASVTRRAREMAHARPDGYLQTPQVRPQPSAVTRPRQPSAPPAERFQSSEPQYFYCQGGEDADDMWSWLCELAGVEPAAVGTWGQINRLKDRRFDAGCLFPFGQAALRSANIAALRLAVRDERAEIWEIERLGHDGMCLRVAATNWRTRAVAQWVRR